MNINILSPINQLGYGIAGLNIVRGLSSLADLALWPIGQPDCPNEEKYTDPLRKSIQNAVMPDFSAPCIKIWHQHDMSQFVGRGEHIGFPIFELNKFNEIETHHLKSLDRIFVCSEWAKDIVTKEIGIKTHVIPLGVDRAIFPDTATESSKTIFLNVGKWEIRKGHDVLVEAFSKAFESSDDVELWMMCDNPFYSKEENEEWESLYKNSKLGSKIRIIPRQQSQKEVYNIMAQCDCGVFPARAEGWNLELLEMMSCGKQVIATNYSAHSEFCNEKNCHLIEVDELEDAYDGKWFRGQGEWANLGEPQIEQLISHMQKVHSTKSLNTEGIKTATRFSWENTAKEIINAIST